MRLPLIANVLDTYRLRKATCAVMHSYAAAHTFGTQPLEDTIALAREAYLNAGQSDHWPQVREAMHNDWNTMWQLTLNDLPQAQNESVKLLRFRTPSLMAMLLHVPVDSSQRWLAAEHPSAREILTHAPVAQSGFDLDEDVGLWPAPLLAFANDTPEHAL